MSTRQRLPDRRHSEGHEVVHVWAKGQATEMHEPMMIRVGRYEDGRIGEVFIDHTDPKMFKNERAKNLGHDIATVLSIALQYGAPVEVLREAVGRGELVWLGELVSYPHTPIGTVLDHLWVESQPKVDGNTNKENG